MEAEELVDGMKECLKGGAGLETPAPCSCEEIAEAEASFKSKFGCGFPGIYKRILARSNGVAYNGLVIWPIKKQACFAEAVEEAVEYCAIECAGKPVWKKFASAEEMFQFALERAWC